MKIGEFAQRYNMNQSAVRYYIEKALLTPVRKNGQYIFDKTCTEQMEKILFYKSLGFSLDEMGTIVCYEDASHLKDKTVLTVTIKGDAKKASDAVREITDVTGVAIQTNPDETADLIIDIKGSNDIREQVSLTLAKQGCIILGMKTDSLSLEDIFLELTGSENEKVEEQEQ